MKLLFRIYLCLFTILFVSHALSEDYDNRCTLEFCEEYRDNGKCKSPNAFCRQNPNATRFLYPDTCNCCEYCIKNLKEGDICVTGRPGVLLPPEMCGPGLQCILNNAGNNATCGKIRNVCTEAQDLFDKRLEEGDVGITEVRPLCDDDGFFKPSHCIPGLICYCVSPMGERIFGEVPFLSFEDEEKMTCGCSINAWRALDTLDPEHSINVARCTESGLFDELQCMMGSNATCLCVGSITGAPETDIDVVLEENMKENLPPCFDSSRHTPRKYSTNCEEEYEYYLSYAESENSNSDEEPVEVKEPFCQPDGKYSRIQLSGSRKVCVDPDGRLIDQYSIEIGDISEKNMNCNCARTLWLLNNVGVVELPTCCPNGNFQAWQCRRNECFCVDNNGNQLGVEVDIDQVAKLKCYADKGGKPC